MSRSHFRSYAALISLALLSFASSSQTPLKRPIAPADVYRLRSVSDLQVSPDGAWIAYVLTSVDTVKDRKNADLWMVSHDGTQSVQLTNSPDGERQPRFSPDGKYLSFIAKRGEDKVGQVYLLDRRGGEAVKATNVDGEINGTRWSPDGAKLLLVIKEADKSDSASSKVRIPYVIDRYHFKQDYEGYLDRRPTHLYLFDVAAKKLDTLTTGQTDETQPAFSPDGSQIVFVSNRTEDPDRNENSDLFVIDAKPWSPVRRLTSWPGSDESPVWSPDGKSIAYLRSSSDELFTMYGQTYLAVLPKVGGEPKVITQGLDRPANNPRWTADSRSLAIILDDDRQTPVMVFDANTGRSTRLTDGERLVTNLEYDKTRDRWIMLVSDPQQPGEIYAFKNGAFKKLTAIHDAFLAPLSLAEVEGFQSRSRDGMLVSGILYRPAGTPKSQKLPLVVYIHGGPVGQDDYGFDFTRQVLSSAGYAVAAVNYRGSSGRGVAFTRAIYGDWGIKEVVDILGAVDHLVAEGIADSNRLGIGGWSYGGIVTNYTIASDARFKAAVSGAASSLQLSMFGSDQYITQYANELGVPWKAPDTWIKLSYPFFHADRIKTPTLFMASQNDFNVPVIGSEQMYQALRHEGVPTEFVIYPNQNHIPGVPSYLKDRLERHIRWFDRYLK